MRVRLAETRWRAAALWLAVGWTLHSAAAQGHGGGGGMGGGFGGGGGFGHSPIPSPRDNTMNRNSSDTRTGSLLLAPPSRWWDNSSIAKEIRLDSRQQHRMDDVFGANRDNLLKLYKSLQQEESALSKTIRAKDLDEGQIFQQIDRVTEARAELEKAEVHMSLQIRRELTPEQTAKLDELREQPATQQ